MSGIPKTSIEDDIRDIFAPYGTIEMLNLIRDKITKESKQSAFVRFSDRIDCITAIDALNGKFVMEVSLSLYIYVCAYFI